ncbi:PBSX family phage terminase large subunit [candidate division TA06 bacterium]|nr:PBSX family phage terminase large subunit [candidate division TA06 bacterium]
MHIYNRYRPHAKQIPFHNSTAKYRAIISGIGFGKSAAGVNEVLKMAFQYPKCTHLICAPTSKILRLSTMNQFWRWCPREIVKKIHKTDKEITLINDAKIIYLSADVERHVDRIRGIEIGSFYADEAALFSHYFWKVLIGRLRDPNGPLKGWFTTTPKGKKWYHWYFIRHQHPDTRMDLKHPEKFEWFGGTTMDNPHTPQEYKDDLLDNYTGKFKRQEIYGEVVIFEGAVYEKFSEETNVFKDIPEGLKEYAVGIDWGFTNPMACLIAGLDGDGRIYILREYYQKRQSPEHLATWLTIKKEEYPFTKGWADPSEPGNIHTLNQNGHSIQQADNSVMAGIQDVNNAFSLARDGKPRLYIHESCKNLLEEINEYRYEEVKEGKGEKEQPVKVKDHAVDALRYLVRSLKSRQTRFGFLEDPENLTGLF